MRLFILSALLLLQTDGQSTGESSLSGSNLGSDSSSSSGNPQTLAAWSLLHKLGTSVPKERFCHAADRCGSTVIAHGGSRETKAGLAVVLSDSWSFNVDTQKWTPITASGNGPTRVYHTMNTIDDAGDKCTLLLFGGSSARSNQNQKTTLLDENKLYELALTRANTGHYSGSWRELKPDGSLPSARNEHVAVGHEKKLFIFGGMSGSDVRSAKQYNDVWSYNHDSKKWQQIDPPQDAKNNGPSKRFSLAATLMLPNGGSRKRTPAPSKGNKDANSGSSGASPFTEPTMIIFGGSSFEVSGQRATIDMLDDLWGFGLETHKWTEFSPLGHSMQRTYMSLVASSNAVLVFGGMSQRSTSRGVVHYVYNDVLKYDFDTKEWSRSNERASDSIESPDSEPAVRFGHTAVMVGDDRMVVFAGRFNSLYNDVWSLNTSRLGTSEFTFQPEDSGEQYTDVLYYVLGSFAIIALCSCLFVVTVKRRVNEERNGVPIPARQGSAHNGGVSSSVLDALPTEIYELPLLAGSTDELPADVETGVAGEGDGEKSSSSAAISGGSDEGCDQCSICMDDYMKGDCLRVLPCNHRFHKACVDPWLLKNKACPLCKHEVDKECTTQSKAFLRSASRGGASTIVRSTSASGDGDIAEIEESETAASQSSSAPAPAPAPLSVSVPSVSSDGPSSDFEDPRRNSGDTTSGEATRSSQPQQAWSASRHGVNLP